VNELAYALELSKTAEEKFEKLRKKNKLALQAIGKKIKQVLDDPYRFKPLRAPLQGKWRIHIDSSFVLIYSIDEAKKSVTVLDYDHHDKIYRN